MMPKNHFFSCHEVAQLTDAKPCGHGWIARCPAHNDDSPSLSINEGDNGKLLLKCFAGCNYRDILNALSYTTGRPPSFQFNEKAAIRSAIQNTDAEHALRIWHASRSIFGSTRAKEYFEQRSLQDIKMDALRFNPSLFHYPTKQWYPAIIAKVADLDDNLLAIHRTYLSHAGSGKAEIVPNKMMLGNLADGAVHLAAAGPILMIGEGLETCLSAMQATGLPVWAALSASRLARVSIPKYTSEIIILADHDPAGQKAASRSAQRWCGIGKRVRVATPPDASQDFNDMLREGV